MNRQNQQRKGVAGVTLCGNGCRQPRATCSLHSGRAVVGIHVIDSGDILACVHGHHVCTLCDAHTASSIATPTPEAKAGPVVGRAGWRKARVDYVPYEREDGRAAVWMGTGVLRGRWITGKPDTRGDYSASHPGWSTLVAGYSGHPTAEAAMAWADAKLAEEDARTLAPAQPVAEKPRGFAVDDTVVCVDAGPGPYGGLPPLELTRGAVYTIARVHEPFVNVRDSKGCVSGGWDPSRFELVSATPEKAADVLPPGWSALTINGGDVDVGEGRHLRAREAYRHTSGVYVILGLDSGWWRDANASGRLQSEGCRGSRVLAMASALGFTIEHDTHANGYRYHKDGGSSALYSTADLAARAACESVGA